MVPYHICKYKESDRKQVLDLFSGGMEEHIPPPSTESWLLPIRCTFILLLFLWFIAGYPWRQYVVMSSHIDFADITKSYLSSQDSCFCLAECGGQVMEIMSAVTIKNPQLGRKQLKLSCMSVALEHQGKGIAKALIKTIFQFAQDQGCSEVVLDNTLLLYKSLVL
ncbi:PREDICTED: probable N-acetyltransferase CML6 [Dipodomys ordii]|uniref:Probable N-acetyltransferase CML6 n=1 Tax=Dipodomys ordii TaxID=10020 RepID=A0A1S3GQX6_DIPOR|nr:PREDICTED: probable N-acetyltransferase CML6 [Dipodomys ordii]